jgi:hypothetical protein
MNKTTSNYKEQTMTVKDLEKLLAGVKDKNAKVCMYVRVGGGTRTQNIEGFETAYNSTLVRLKADFRDTK